MVVTVRGTLPTSVASTYEITYTVFGTGETKVDQTVHPGAPNLPYLPEVGTILFLPAEFAHPAAGGRAPGRTRLPGRRAS